MMAPWVVTADRLLDRSAPYDRHRREFRTTTKICSLRTPAATVAASCASTTASRTRRRDPARRSARRTRPAQGRSRCSGLRGRACIRSGSSTRRSPFCRCSRGASSPSPGRARPGRGSGAGARQRVPKRACIFLGELAPEHIGKFLAALDCFRCFRAAPRLSGSRSVEPRQVGFPSSPTSRFSRTFSASRASLAPSRRRARSRRAFRRTVKKPVLGDPPALLATKLGAVAADGGSLSGLSAMTGAYADLIPDAGPEPAMRIALDVGPRRRGGASTGCCAIGSRAVSRRPASNCAPGQGPRQPLPAASRLLAMERNDLQAFTGNLVRFASCPRFWPVGLRRARPRDRPFRRRWPRTEARPRV